MITVTALCSLVLAGCGTSASTEKPAAGGAAPAAEQAKTAEKKVVAVTQVTNWFAQPEHGGQYAALKKGFYKDAGLDMTIQPGGPGISATQIVASGKADFGMGQGDEILFARQNGIPLVAVMAIFQKNPQALLFHKGQAIKGFSDLNGRKVYVGSGVAYWEYIKKAYKLDKVEELKYTGQLANFISDPTSVTQSYVTSEPFALKQQGVETDYLLNADSGYSPYGNVLFTTEKMIKEHPEVVKAYVEATIKGWDYYKDNYQEINEFIKEKNPDTPLDKMEFSAKAMSPFVYGDDAATKGVGYMTKNRWESLMKQLVEIGLLKSEIDVTKVFNTDFIPKK
nr:ABC transporter substrate-binding protein [Paenibacillus rigui]